MKQLKERVETEDKELLAKGKDFLEETLCPIADCNNRKRKRKFGMIGTVCCVILLLGSSIGIGIVYKNLFAATYETKSSDVTYLNSTLTHTQVTGEFDSISLTYEKRHDRPIYFLGIYEREEAETSYTNVRINVIIDRGYTMEKTSYSKALDFWEYSVEYTDTEVIEDPGEFVLYGYHVEGYIDTGAERYKIDYIEFSFKNANSTWARGKIVTDYVTLTPAADGALTAVVENKAEFGEQIVVKVTSRDNVNAYATCKVEYLQRTLKHVFVAAQVGNTGSPFYQIGADNNSSAEIKLDFSYDRTIQPYLDVRKSSVYTRENADGATYYTLKPTTQFLNSLKGITAVTSVPKSFEGGLTDVSGRLCAPIEFFSKSWGEAIYGTGAAAPAAKNQLIRILQQDYGHYNNFNAYEIVMYDKRGGIQLAKYGIHFDLSAVENQFRVENVIIDDTEVMF